MRRLVEIGLETTTTRQVFLATKFQIMTAALTPGPRERIADAYLFAWDEEVYPIFHEVSEWHKPFESSFRISKEMITELGKYLDDLWINGKKIPSFYELEDHYGVRSGYSDWDRWDLIVALRYMRLSRRFDDALWNAIMKPAEHPTEASAITESFNRDEDIYFN